MQKKESLLLSHTGLKYHLENNKDIFEQVKNEYLSKRWLACDIETQIREIAHNIRNQQSFRNRQQKRLYKKEQMNFMEIF